MKNEENIISKKKIIQSKKGTIFIDSEMITGQCYIKGKQKVLRHIYLPVDGGKLPRVWISKK